MHLYGSTASPFVQRVLMTARAKGHELELQAPPGGSMRSDEFRAISPMGRIPVLALDDGQHLCESEAIAAYLDDTLEGPPLLPQAPLARARVREIVAVALAEVGAGLRPLMVHLVFRMGDAPEVVAAARAQLDRGLDALDRLVAAEGYATGSAVTAADCALIPILTLAQIVEPITAAWTAIAARPRIASYYERTAREPLAKRTIEEMQQGFVAILQRNTAV